MTDHLTDSEESIEPAAETLTAWWVALAEDDAEKTIPKTIEYGSRGEDLEEIGRHMAAMANLYPPFTDQDTGLEVEDSVFYQALGCHFYIVGKHARSAEAFRHGQVPKNDTLFDTTVYSIMSRRIKEAGRWGA